MSSSKNTFKFEKSIFYNVRVLFRLKRYISPDYIRGFIQFLEFTTESIFDWRLKISLGNISLNSTLLHVSVGFNMYQLTVWLLGRKFPPDIRDINGYTPMNKACLEDHCVHVYSLLESGADPLIPNNEGYLPIHHVHDNPIATQLLLDHGSPIDALTNYGQTPLLIASGRDHRKKAALLIKMGADRDCNTLDGFSDIQLAGLFCHEKITLELLESKFGGFISDQELKRIH